MTLGSSLQHVVSKIKSQPQNYANLDLSYSSSQPVWQTITLNLPTNGIRLRFDGPHQRLKLIEVLDFARTNISYKGLELVKLSRTADDGHHTDHSAGPTFKHIYHRLFGPAYEGEYKPPDLGHSTGDYVLSYPGLAFTFPISHRSWSDKADFVSILSSTATGPATSMALFSGSSWPEARATLFATPSPLPRPGGAPGKTADSVPGDVEEVQLFGSGKLEFRRRGAQQTSVQLNETTPQDLVAEFGPPDAIYRKHDSKISIHAGQRPRSRRGSSLSPALAPTSLASDHSSGQSYTDDSDADDSERNSDPSEGREGECFYNYFAHGFDALISTPSEGSPPFPGMEAPHLDGSTASQLVVTKIILHGNVPGSYSFNRHRRCRWSIHSHVGSRPPELTSESLFSEISNGLRKIWQDAYGNAEEEMQMQRGMVLNRGWRDSPGSSMELLGGFEEATEAKQGQATILNNTELFGFPGMLFEVLKNDFVSCVTIY